MDAVEEMRRSPHDDEHQLSFDEFRAAKELFTLMQDFLDSFDEDDLVKRED